MKVKLVFIVCVFIGIKSFAQNTTSSSSNIPKKIWSQTDKYGRLTIDPESVTHFTNRDVKIVDTVLNPTQKDLYILRSDLEKCKNLKGLTLITQDSISLDLTKFPDLVRVDFSFLYSEEQINQLVNTSKKIKTMTLTPPCTLFPNLFKLKNLEILYLNFSNNSTPVKIDSNINNLNALKFILIEGYNLEYHSALWNIPHLTTLKINNTQRVEMPKKCKSGIKHLIIDNCGIIEVPEKMIGFDSLLLFQMEYMQFKIDGKYLINSFKNLKGFKCNESRLNYFPKTDQLKYLEEIIIMKSYIRNYTANFKNNVNIKRIDFQFTSEEKIEKFPKNLKSCVNIEFLNTNIDVKVVPDYFKEFQKLKCLVLYDTRIDYNPKKTAKISYKSAKILTQIPSLEICFFEYDETWTEKQKEELKDFKERKPTKKYGWNEIEKCRWYPYEITDFKLYKE